MQTPATQPLDIDLDRTRDVRIRWADGHRSVIPLTALRKACPCAECRGRRRRPSEGALPVVQPEVDEQAMVEVERAELVGNYALGLTWRDGHSTGIYDFALLRSLAPADTDGNARATVDQRTEGADRA